MAVRDFPTRGGGVRAGCPSTERVAQHEQAHPLTLRWVCRDLVALEREEAGVTVLVAEPDGGQLVAEPVRRPVESGGQEARR